MSRTVHFICGARFKRAGNDISATIFSDGRVLWVDHTTGDHGEYDTFLRRAAWAAKAQRDLDLSIDVPNHIERGLGAPTSESARHAEYVKPQFSRETATRSMGAPK